MKVKVGETAHLSHLMQYINALGMIIYQEIAEGRCVRITGRTRTSSGTD